MNRYKKEETLKAQKRKVTLSPSEIITSNTSPALEQEISKLARKLHIERFPEEYDHQYDSLADAADRAKGINPMSQEYIEEVNQRRKDAGVPPLAENGMPTSQITYELCYEEVKSAITSSEFL